MEWQHQARFTQTSTEERKETFKNKYSNKKNCRVSEQGCRKGLFIYLLFGFCQNFVWDRSGPLFGKRSMLRA